MEVGFLGYGAMEETARDESYGGDEREENGINIDYAFSNPKPKPNMRFVYWGQKEKIK